MYSGFFDQMIKYIEEIQLLLLHDPCGDIFDKSILGFKTEVSGNFIGELHVQLFALNVVDGNVEDGVLAGTIGVAGVGVGEGDLNIKVLAGHVTDELLKKIVNVVGDADGNVGALTLGTSAVKFDAVYAADVVDVEGVSVLNGTVGDLFVYGVFGKKSIYLLLQILFGSSEGVCGDGNLLVFGQGDVFGSFEIFDEAVFVKSIRIGEVFVVGYGRAACKHCHGENESQSKTNKLCKARRKFFHKIHPLCFKDSYIINYSSFCTQIGK